MANHKSPNKDRILKNGCYYEKEGSNMVVAIAPYGNIKTNTLKTNNYEAERHIKGL
jgi:hypothetical protein